MDAKRRILNRISQDVGAMREIEKDYRVADANNDLRRKREKAVLLEHVRGELIGFLMSYEAVTNEEEPEHADDRELLIRARSWAGWDDSWCKYAYEGEE